MSKRSGWFKGLVGLLVLVAFALALAWLFGAAQPQGAAGPPPPTFAPPPTAEPTLVLPAETPAREATRFVPGPTVEGPGPTLSPIVTASVPAPTPTPPPEVPGRIVYKYTGPTPLLLLNAQPPMLGKSLQKRLLRLYHLSLGSCRRRTEYSLLWLLPVLLNSRHLVLRI